MTYNDNLITNILLEALQDRWVSAADASFCISTITEENLYLVMRTQIEEWENRILLLEDTIRRTEAELKAARNSPWLTMNTY